MKRLDFLTDSGKLAVEEKQSEVFQYKIKRFKNRRTALEFFTPLHYESGYAYPLLVWLHSAEMDERQIRRIMPLTSTRNFVSVAPRATNSVRGKQGFCWSESPLDIDKASSRILNAVDLAIDKYHVHPERIYIAGEGSGGTMALRLALRHPEVFSGAATIGGQFPQSQAPLKNLLSVRSLPLLLMHRQNSERYSEHQLCADLKLLHTAGMKLDIRQYLCNEELNTEMFNDLNSWLMNLVTG